MNCTCSTARARGSCWLFVSAFVNAFLRAKLHLCFCFWCEINEKYNEPNRRCCRVSHKSQNFVMTKERKVNELLNKTTIGYIPVKNWQRTTRCSVDWKKKRRYERRYKKNINEPVATLAASTLVGLAAAVAMTTFAGGGIWNRLKFVVI